MPASASAMPAPSVTEGETSSETTSAAAGSALASETVAGAAPTSETRKDSPASYVTGGPAGTTSEDRGPRASRGRDEVLLDGQGARLDEDQVSPLAAVTAAPGGKMRPVSARVSTVSGRSNGPSVASISRSIVTPSIGASRSALGVACRAVAKVACGASSPRASSRAIRSVSWTSFTRTRSTSCRSCRAISVSDGSSLPSARSVWRRVRHYPADRPDRVIRAALGPRATLRVAIVPGTPTKAGRPAAVRPALSGRSSCGAAPAGRYCAA